MLRDIDGKSHVGGLHPALQSDFGMPTVRFCRFLTKSGQSGDDHIADTTPWPYTFRGENIAMQRSVQMLAMTSLFVVAGCSGKPAGAPQEVDIRAIERTAHGSYVAAINSNDVDTLMSDLTDDIVYQAPGAPEVVGKAAVRDWVAGYFGAYRTRWEKTSLGFTVSGDWAFERYTYKSTDTDKKTGAVTTDVGKGINIFRRGSDGKWRVAIDGWSSDQATS